MPVSVVIPVYNAAPYVREAVESALAQPETGEVILVEDASPDDSLRVCEELAAEYDTVRLLRHPKGENRGAAESRNLGLHESRYDLVAFLDADDFYLPGRFSVSARILAEQPDIDGVYEAMDLHFDTPADRERWNRTRAPLNHIFAQMPSGLAPEQVFAHFTSRQRGHFHINALLVRRQAALDVGGFDGHLRVTQDAIFTLKLTIAKRLLGGELARPVAMLRVHGANRITGVQRPASENQRWLFRGWLHIWRWGRDHMSRQQKGNWLRYFLRFINHGTQRKTRWQRFVRYWRGRSNAAKLLPYAPDLLLYPEYWVIFPPRLHGVIHHSRHLLRKLRTLTGGSVSRVE